MAASDYVPIFFKNRLHLVGRPQMGSRFENRSERAALADEWAVRKPSNLARRCSAVDGPFCAAEAFLSRLLLLLWCCRRTSGWGRVSRRGFFGLRFGFSLLLWSGRFNGRSLISLSASV